MKNRRNYYRILHVQPDAPREIIRSSYQAMMQKLRLHPDLGGDPRYAAMINEAYATLTNPQNRAAYDKTRSGPELIRPSRKSLHEIDFTSSLPVYRCAFCASLNECDKKASPWACCSNCQSPLFLANQQKREEGRRAITRVPREQSMVFRTHWPQREPEPARTSDISLSGMKFFTSVSLIQGQIIKIDSPTLRAVARVTRSQQVPTDRVVGVQFISLGFERNRGSFVTERA